MAEFSRLIPVEVFDNEASQLISNNTKRMHVAVRELVTIYQDVKSVNGHTGELWLNKSDIGLGNVANLTPAQYPLSDAAVGALSLKMDKNQALPISRIDGLEEALATRVKSVNGNLPDSTGNVQLQLTSGAYMPTWTGEVEDQEIPVFFKPSGGSGDWVHRPIQAVLAGQLLPVPASDGSDDGEMLRVVEGLWQSVAPHVPYVTAADNGKVATVVAGAWQAQELPAGPAPEQLLPTPAPADVGKVMQVQPDGTFALSELRLRAPNGTVYKLTVDNAGALSATEV